MACRRPPRSGQICAYCWGDTRIFRRNYLICGIFTLGAESYSEFEVGMGLGAGAAGSRGWSIGLALPLIAFAQNPPCGPSRPQVQVDDSVMRIDVNLVQLDAVVARIPARLCTHPDADLVEVVCGRTSDDSSDAPAARYFLYTPRGFHGQSSPIRVLDSPQKHHCWPRSRSIFHRGLG
jgi:hypothetical protein